MPARRQPRKARGKSTRKKSPPQPTGQVQKTVAVDPDKLARARQLLQLDDDGAIVRRALDYLIEHHPPVRHEEEE
ncbi:hypothetical protein AYO44_11750 [Planctomycetaceae bacterium SCGC AG-212-F19]|nr:hypothetical protein AYO44_11750 [Planctomycetaceae bacterium SCGC AG-212-F19]